MSLIHCATHCHSRSIAEFPVGWCARVVVCLQPIISHSLLTAFEINSLAASEWRCNGHPSLNIIPSSKHSVTVAALRFLHANNLHSDVAKSMKKLSNALVDLQGGPLSDFIKGFTTGLERSEEFKAILGPKGS